MTKNLDSIVLSLYRDVSFVIEQTAISEEFHNSEITYRLKMPIASGHFGSISVEGLNKSKQWSTIQSSIKTELTTVMTKKGNKLVEINRVIISENGQHMSVYAKDEGRDILITDVKEIINPSVIVTAIIPEGITKLRVRYQTNALTSSLKYTFNVGTDNVDIKTIINNDHYGEINANKIIIYTNSINRVSTPRYESAYALSRTSSRISTSETNVELPYKRYEIDSIILAPKSSTVVSLDSHDVNYEWIFEVQITELTKRDHLYAVPHLKVSTKNKLPVVFYQGPIEIYDRKEDSILLVSNTEEKMTPFEISFVKPSNHVKVNVYNVVDSLKNKLWEYEVSVKITSIIQTNTRLRMVFPPSILAFKERFWNVEGNREVVIDVPTGESEEEIVMRYREPNK